MKKRYLLVFAGFSLLFGMASGNTGNFVRTKLVTDSGDLIEVLQRTVRPDSLSEAVLFWLLKDIVSKEQLGIASSDRIIKLLEGDDPFCVPYRLKNREREDKFLFSLPIDILAPHKLYQLGSSSVISDEFLNTEGELLSLTHYFNKNPEQLLLLISGHTYGALLDMQIGKIARSNLVYRNGNDPYEPYIKMLLKGRTDFILLYPSVVRNYMPPPTLLRSYAIEGSNELTAGYIMCNKSKENKNFLDRINKKLFKAYKSGEFLNTYSQYYEDEELKKIREFVDHVSVDYQSDI